MYSWYASWYRPTLPACFIKLFQFAVFCASRGIFLSISIASSRLPSWHFFANLWPSSYALRRRLPAFEPVLTSSDFSFSFPFHGFEAWRTRVVGGVRCADVEGSRDTEAVVAARTWVAGVDSRRVTTVNGERAFRSIVLVRRCVEKRRHCCSWPAKTVVAGKGAEHLSCSGRLGRDFRATRARDLRSDLLRPVLSRIDSPPERAQRRPDKPCVLDVLAFLLIVSSSPCTYTPPSCPFLPRHVY